MSDVRASGDTANAGFAGRTPATGARHRSDAEPLADAVRAVVMSTMPIVLTGALAVGFGLTGPIETASAAPKHPMKPKADSSRALKSQVAAAAAPAAATSAPTQYTVVSGDSVSRIASRFGLSTAAILVLNGLSRTSLIFPGQVLRLTGAAAAPSAPVTPSAASTQSGRYTITRGDTVSRIAARFGITTQAVLSANGLGWSSIIYPGQTLTIPGGSLSLQTVSSVTPIAGPDESHDPVSTPPVAVPAPVINNTYTIKSGDTVSSIAQKFGVSVSAVLAANGLAASSIIYAGRSLVIPGVVAAQDGTTVTPLTAEMAANARIVIQIGRQLGVPDRGIVIALAAAMQESSLRNVSYGDRDSVGLFQQRTSTGWGPVTSLLDVSHAARLFYGGPSNPNGGKTRGLLDISGWQNLTVTQAAQKVQISAYPNAYAKWETSARAWLAQLG
ncbi:hypothetical protein BH11ACT3_BH11ACT3_17560 [soil metagenome]